MGPASVWAWPLVTIQVVAALHALGAGELADSEVRKWERQVTRASSFIVGLCCLRREDAWLSNSTPSPPLCSTCWHVP